MTYIPCRYCFNSVQYRSCGAILLVLVCCIFVSRSKLQEEQRAKVLYFQGAVPEFDEFDEYSFFCSSRWGSCLTGPCCPKMSFICSTAYVCIYVCSSAPLHHVHISVCIWVFKEVHTPPPPGWYGLAGGGNFAPGGSGFGWAVLTAPPPPALKGPENGYLNGKLAGSAGTWTQTNPPTGGCACHV